MKLCIIILFIGLMECDILIEVLVMDQSFIDLV